MAWCGNTTTGQKFGIINIYYAFDLRKKKKSNYSKLLTGSVDYLYLTLCCTLAIFIWKG